MIIQNGHRTNFSHTINQKKINEFKEFIKSEEDVTIFQLVQIKEFMEKKIHEARKRQYEKP